MNGTKIVAGGGVGAGAGIALVHFAGHFGMTLTGEDGAWLAATVMGACAFVAHNGGLLGVARIILRGVPTLPTRTVRKRTASS